MATLCPANANPVIGFYIDDKNSPLPYNFCFKCREDAQSFAENNGFDKRFIIVVREGQLSNPTLGNYDDALKFVEENNHNQDFTFCPSMG